jgi:NAD(P)-dependent dehydrogenase (short-subunit alcohol dehydrogenase family)
MDLKGVVALVTGGNGGLGQCICHALAQEGAHVAVMYPSFPSATSFKQQPLFNLVIAVQFP